MGANTHFLGPRNTIDFYEAAHGVIPAGNANTPADDWQGFSINLNRSIKAGRTFTSYSFYTINVTRPGGGFTYSGSVISPNGDIHFVPSSAPVGQKISPSGVASTYTLIYTATAAYVGGVLAPNGDIHFVPFYANRGQKVSASGVVTTYSLLKTDATNGAYIGGVVALNGDIHFIPYGANVGQKVSSSGTVSTYSLIYTSSTSFGIPGPAHGRGVLAPNGDIHFGPYGSDVGQKVSPSGVVSTYSLVIPGGNGAFLGGVVAPNGDIHFIPCASIAGQKISAAGVVSTYALAYTGDGLSVDYDGGVIDTNGDIHFAKNSFTAPMQKVDINGVVSTYDSIFDSIGVLYGNPILTPSGEVYFLPSGDAPLVSMVTYSARPLDFATCASPYLNKS